MRPRASSLPHEPVLRAPLTIAARCPAHRPRHLPARASTATAVTTTRIYTLRGLGDKEDMAVDLGAYRYIDGRHSLVQGLTENLLQLNYTLYDVSSSSAAHGAAALLSAARSNASVGPLAGSGRAGA